MVYRVTKVCVRVKKQKGLPVSKALTVIKLKQYTSFVRKCFFHKTAFLSAFDFFHGTSPVQMISKTIRHRHNDHHMLY